MSIVQSCPYDINGEHCKYEIYYGEPIFSKCKNCSRTIFKRGVEMTDKELAEEYVKKEVPFDTTESGEKLYTESALKQAFLEGLKARPQWHDLRKDKNDLPKRDKDFVVKVTIPVMTHPSYVFATYYFDNKKWFSFGEEIEVIAWCEIPTFDKE